MPFPFPPALTAALTAAATAVVTATALLAPAGTVGSAPVAPAAPFAAAPPAVPPAAPPAVPPTDGCRSRRATPTTVWVLPLAGAAVVARFRIGPRPWSPGHRGVDLAPRAGNGPAAVLAAGPGVVRFAGTVAGRGVVSVDHGSGLRTTYQPVDPTVRRGERVRAGQPLGLLVPTGSHCATTCLHWGALSAGRYLDPLGLLTPRQPPILLTPP